MQFSFPRAASVIMVWASLMAAGMAQAGTALLSAQDQAQLAAWLGEGNVRFNSIYTKTDGDTAAQFHAAVDGKGRTVSVMRASNNAGQSWLIGGYNPQSWNSSGQFNLTVKNEDRTAFLFNLTAGKMHRQVLDVNGLGGVGSYQTYNDRGIGPAFGLGSDLYVGNDLKTGYSLLYSYIDPVTGGWNTSLLDGSPYHAGNVTFGAIEVYSIAAVPEPGTYGMLLLGLLGMLGWAGYRRHGEKQD